MSAVEALRLAEENGVHLGVAGTDLILDADREPAPSVLEAIRIVAGSVSRLPEEMFGVSIVASPSTFPTASTLR